MKNVLVLIHDDAGQEARLQAALDLARALEGHLSCIDVSIVPMMVDDYMAVGGAAMLMAEERQNEQANRTKVEARLAREDVPYDWTDVTGEPAMALQDAAKLADVIVVNRQLEGIAYPDFLRIAGELVVTCGKPVVAVPESARSFDAAGKALVAWDGSETAAAALRAALPLLQLASEVTIVEVDDGSIRAPASEAAQYLSRHGIEPVIRRTNAAADLPSTILMNEAVGLGAAYMVMGGYGTSRAVEALFGGVTRRMLVESPVPLVLAR